MISNFNGKMPGLFFCLAASLLLLNAKALASDKKTSFALSHYIMGSMYDSLKQTDMAIKEYKEALRTDYSNSVIHLNLAISYIKNNELKRAIGELNLSVKFDPEAIEPHAILALLYSWQNKTKEASYEYEVALKNASKLQPQNIDIYKSLGVLYLHQKKTQAALDTFKLILEFSPDDAQAHFYLGNAYDELSNRPEAEKELKKTLELAPDYHEALNYLGYLYVEENKNLDEAEAMIKKALEMEPDNGAYVDSLGWLYFKQGKFKEALKELERASNLLEDSVILEHLGDVYFKIGDFETARLNWQKSLKLNPEQDKVKEKIENIGKP